MIHSLTVTRTLTYEVKVDLDERNGRHDAEVAAWKMVVHGNLPHVTEDWEYIHPNGTRHYVPEGAL